MPKRQQSSSSLSDESSESVNINFSSVSVAKLSPNITQGHLKQIFSHFGTVKSVVLTKGPKLTSSAKINFQKKQQADFAVTYMNNGYIDGSKITVENQAEANKAEKQPERKKSIEKPIKKQIIEKDRRASKNRQNRRERQRYRQKQSRQKDRARRQRNRRSRQRESSSSSSSSAVSSSSGSSSGRSSRS